MRTLAPYPSTVQQLRTLALFRLRNTKWVPVLAGLFVIPMISLLWNQAPFQIELSSLPLDASAISPFVFFCLFAPGVYETSRGPITRTSAFGFLSTRPIDRCLLFRIKALLSWTVVVVIGLSIFVGRELINPNLEIAGNDATLGYVHSVLGGTLIAENFQHGNSLLVPGGKVYYGLLDFYVFLLAALISQFFLTAFSRLPLTPYLSLAFLVLTCAVLPFSFDGFSNDPGASTGAHIFIGFLMCQPYLWPALFGGIVAVQMWAEKLLVRADLET